MPNLLMRLASLDELANAPVRDVLAEMGGLGADQLALTVCDDDFQALGGLVCLHGPHTQRYMDAIRAVRDQIENEQFDNRRSHA